MGELLKGKICIITGGSRGIGRAITEIFAKEGALVYSIGTNLSSFDEWLPTSKYSSSIIPMGVDITNTALVKEAILSIKKKQGKIDVLVNNAGIEFNERIGMISRSNMEKMFQVNVYAPIELIQLVSRVMSRQSKGGSIINISSVVGSRGNAGQLVYSATKGAIISMTMSAAKELAHNKIRVNSVAPGLTNTEMIAQVESEKLNKRIENISMGKIAEPEDIANACLFLASDLSSYISGQVLVVDGFTIL